MGAESQSFLREIELDETIGYVIEYAIWWDWDIQHLYALEYIWININPNSAIVSAEASWHGGQHAMLDEEE